MVVPISTVYIRNLNERIPTDKLIAALKLLFDPYGKITLLSAKKHFRLRGQAFISFVNSADAIAAIAGENQKLLFNKPMDVQLGRNPSLVFVTDDAEREEINSGRKKRRVIRDEILEKKKKERVQVPKQTKKTPAATTPQQKKDQDFLPPNSILFVQNLPKSTTTEGLAMLFTQYSGFIEIRLVPGRPEMAFVEYENEFQSEVAKINLNGYRLKLPEGGEQIIKVTFAKK